jgi:uncharacterized protein (TIGR00255 family)
MSLKSMTGFGVGNAATDLVEVSVEVKSVNNRFLDIVCRFPNSYSRFENKCAKLAKSKLDRGRVDISVSRRELSIKPQDISFNQELYENYLKIAKQLADESGFDPQGYLQEASLKALSRREVLEFGASENSDNSAEEKILLEALGQALDGLIQMRVDEGTALEKEIKSLLGSVNKVAGKISKLAPSVPQEFKERLSKRIDKLQQTEFKLDEARLAQEVALIADRTDITEELARIDSHSKQFAEGLEQNQGGRKLEFILQELLREFNTIGSKTQNIEISTLVIDGKSFLEKIREQAANVE